MTGRFQESLEVSLRGFKANPSSASLLLLVAVGCLRQDRLVEAENALIEATLLDSRNAEVWMFMSLLCLAHGSARLDEAIKALHQALRIGTVIVKSPSLLRELATSFIAVDKLQIAEDLIRRALASEASVTDNGRTNSYSRKILADILAGQNQASLAVGKYKLDCCL